VNYQPETLGPIGPDPKEDFADIDFIQKLSPKQSNHGKNTTNVVIKPKKRKAIKAKKFIQTKTQRTD